MIDQTKLRTYLDQFKPYFRDNKHSIDSILDFIASGVIKFIGPETIVRTDITVLSTTEYSIFKSITSNREVVEKHVKKLVDSIAKKNLLYVRPILINENMEVIDGQHRLEACMILKISVPYMICPGLTKEDIHFLNTVQKNWTTMDFINYFTIEDRAGFRQFSRLCNEFTKVRVSILIKLCSNRRVFKIRDGIIDISRIDEARKICQYLIKLGSFWKKKKEYEFVYSAAFAMALQKCVRIPHFQFDRLYKQIELYPDLFIKYTSRNEYLRSINLVYNKNQTKTLKLAPDTLI